MTTAQQRIVVAVNPSASFGKNHTVGAKVVAALTAAGHSVSELRKADYASLVAASHEAVATSPDAFIVVGGDGMVNLGANVTAKTGVPLGIVPAGTGNDMARALGIPHSNTDAAIAVLVEALSRPAAEIDAGLITHVDESGVEKTTWFACMISAGFDALANERANRMRRPRGASRYIIALVIELAKLKPIRYRLVLDGVEMVTDAALVSVGNGVSLGGGMKVTPDAMLDDGLFDVLVVQPMSRTAFMRIFPRVFKGTHVSDHRVAVHRAASVVIESEGIAAYADGERLGRLPIAIELVPAALLVLAPEPEFEPPIVIAKQGD
jgi:diacylglycerol kinase (ATP)